MGIKSNETMEIDKSKLSFLGSLNYIVQAWRHRDGTVQVSQYQPRKNRLWVGEMTEEEARVQIAETIERMKIAMPIMQDFIDGKTDNFYYWELKDEKH